MSTAATHSPPALEVGALSKTFPGTRALIDVDLDVRRGEIHALVGQNGSGKSTVIKILAGFHDADPGAWARVRGAPYDLGSAHAAHAAGVRFVHQDLGLVPTLDAVDNIALGYGYDTGRWTRIRWRRQQAATRRAIESIGYRIDVHTPTGRLQPIERTALAIARALQGLDGHVSLLVLDEPTATMPQPETERLFRIVKRVSERGIGVLYVSHHLDEVFTIADRVTVLRDGRSVATSPVVGLSKRALIELMTGGIVDAATSTSTRAHSEPVLEATTLKGRELQGVDLAVHEGEVLGVAGITGSGREEVCSLLFGGRNRSGEVRVGGTLLEPMRPDRAVALGVGLVPADRHRDGLVLAMNVRENLTLTDLRRFRGPFGIRQRSERREVSRSVERFSVKTRTAEAPTGSLSGGNQQKVVIGKWLRVQPRVLLLDEPTQGVDVAAKAEVHHLIRRAASEGTAVLVCSSDEDELERLCDRVVVLRRGRVAAEFSRPHVSAPRLVHESLEIEPARSGGGDAL